MLLLISSPLIYRLRDTTGYHSCPACQEEKHRAPSSLGCVTPPPPVKLLTHRNSDLIVCFGLMAIFFSSSSPVSHRASRQLRSPTQSSPVTVHDVPQRADGCSSLFLPVSLQIGYFISNPQSHVSLLVREALATSITDTVEPPPTPRRKMQYTHM